MEAAGIAVVDVLILSLAVWRISSLVSSEQGPWAMFEKYRQWMGVYYAPDGTLIPPNNQLGKLIACPWCNSVWFSIIAVVLYVLFSTLIVWIALPLAMSAVAIIINTIVAEK